MTFDPKRNNPSLTSSDYFNRGVKTFNQKSGMIFDYDPHKVSQIPSNRDTTDIIKENTNTNIIYNINI